MKKSGEEMFFWMNNLNSDYFCLNFQDKKEDGVETKEEEEPPLVDISEPATHEPEAAPKTEEITKVEAAKEETVQAEAKPVAAAEAKAVVEEKKEAA